MLIYHYSIYIYKIRKLEEKKEEESSAIAYFCLNFTLLHSVRNNTQKIPQAAEVSLLRNTQDTRAGIADS